MPALTVEDFITRLTSNIPIINRPHVFFSNPADINNQCTIKEKIIQTIKWCGYDYFQFTFSQSITRNFLLVTQSFLEERWAQLKEDFPILPEWEDFYWKPIVEQISAAAEFISQPDVACRPHSAPPTLWSYSQVAPPALQQRYSAPVLRFSAAENDQIPRSPSPSSPPPTQIANGSKSSFPPIPIPLSPILPSRSFHAAGSVDSCRTPPPTIPEETRFPIGSPLRATRATKLPEFAPGSPRHKQLRTKLDDLTAQTHQAITTLFSLPSKAKLEEHFLIPIPGSSDMTRLDQTLFVPNKLHFALYLANREQEVQAASLQQVLQNTTDKLKTFYQPSAAIVSADEVESLSRLIICMLYDIRNNPCLILYELIKEWFSQYGIAFLKIKPIADNPYFSVTSIQGQPGYFIYFFISVMHLLDQENNSLDFPVNSTEPGLLTIQIMYQVNLKTQGAYQGTSSFAEIKPMICEIKSWMKKNYYLDQVIATWNIMLQDKLLPGLIVQIKQKLDDPLFKTKHSLADTHLFTIEAEKLLTPRHYSKNLLRFALRYPLESNEKKNKEFNTMLNKDAVRLIRLQGKEFETWDLLAQECRKYCMEENILAELKLTIGQSALNPVFYLRTIFMAYLRCEMEQFSTKTSGLASMEKMALRKSNDGGFYVFCQTPFLEFLLGEQEVEFKFRVFKLRSVINLGSLHSMKPWYGKMYLLLEPSLVECLQSKDYAAGVSYYTKLTQLISDMNAQGFPVTTPDMELLFAGLYKEELDKRRPQLATGAVGKPTS